MGQIISLNVIWIKTATSDYVASCLNSWSLWALCKEWKWLCINEVILKIKLTLQLTVCGLWNMSITLRDDGPLEPHRTHHLTWVVTTCEASVRLKLKCFSFLLSFFFFFFSSTLLYLNKVTSRCTHIHSAWCLFAWTTRLRSRAGSYQEV